MGIPLSHLIFELSVYALFAGCLYHAWRQDKGTFVNLLTFLFYGFALEYVGLNHKYPPDYSYGPFLLTLYRDTYRALPFSIVAGWSCIIYAALETSRKLGGVPGYLRPFVVAVVGIFIDLILDPVAAGPGGLGMWHWEPRTDRYWWLGVPLSNYVGWIVVMFNFTLFTWLSQKLFPAKKRSIFAYLLISLGVTLASATLNTIELLLYIRFVWSRPSAIVLPCLVAAIGLGILFYYRKRLDRSHSVDWLIYAVPVFFYGFSLLEMLIAGTYKTLPALLWLGPIVTLVGMWLFTLPYTKKLLPRRF